MFKRGCGHIRQFPEQYHNSFILTLGGACKKHYKTPMDLADKGIKL